jgi:hypothetical protein
MKPVTPNRICPGCGAYYNTLAALCPKCLREYDDVQHCPDAYWSDLEHWTPKRRTTWRHVLCLLALPFAIVLLLVAGVILGTGAIIEDELKAKQEA